MFKKTKKPNPWENTPNPNENQWDYYEREIMRNPKFVEFSVKYANRLGIENISKDKPDLKLLERIAKIYQAFLKKEYIIGQAQDTVYSTTKKLTSGITANTPNPERDAAILEHLETTLDATIIHTPEKITELEKLLKEREKLTKQLESKQTELSKITSQEELVDLEKYLDDLRKLSKRNKNIQFTPLEEMTIEERVVMEALVEFFNRTSLPDLDPQFKTLTGIKKQIRITDLANSGRRFWLKKAKLGRTESKTATAKQSLEAQNKLILSALNLNDLPKKLFMEDLQTSFRKSVEQIDKNEANFHDIQILRYNLNDAASTFESVGSTHDSRQAMSLYEKYAKKEHEAFENTLKEKWRKSAFPKDEVLNSKDIIFNLEGSNKGYKAAADLLHGFLKNRRIGTMEGQELKNFYARFLNSLYETELDKRKRGYLLKFMQKNGIKIKKFTPINIPKQLDKEYPPQLQLAA